MKNLKIRVLDTGYDSFAYEEQLFRSNGHEFEVWAGRKDDVTGKTAFASDADGLLIRWTVVDDQFLRAMKRLKRTSSRIGHRIDGYEQWTKSSSSTQSTTLFYISIKIEHKI